MEQVLLTTTTMASPMNWIGTTTTTVSSKAPSICLREPTHSMCPQTATYCPGQFTHGPAQSSPLDTWSTKIPGITTMMAFLTRTSMDPAPAHTTRTMTTTAELINSLGLAISMVMACRITWIPMMTTMVSSTDLMPTPTMLATIRKLRTPTLLGSTMTTHPTVDR